MLLQMGSFPLEEHNCRVPPNVADGLFPLGREDGIFPLGRAGEGALLVVAVDEV